MINWLPDPFAAFEHLSGYGLDALLDMEPAGFWRDALRPVSIDEASDASFDLRSLVSSIIGLESWYGALMAPRTRAKSGLMEVGAPAETLFRARAVAAQIGWLETCVSFTAAPAIANAESLLRAGLSEQDPRKRHQSLAFEAFELGLLATWEVPDSFSASRATERNSDRPVDCR